MQTALENSYIVYGSILLAGIVAVAVLLLRSYLERARAKREAQLLIEKNQAIEQMNRQAMDLAHQQGLHMVGELTSSIAHEFNNLLTPMMGYSLLALEQVSPEDEELYDSLLEIYNAACKAKEIISRLSLINRKKSAMLLKFVAVDDAVRAVREVILPIKPQHVEIELSCNCEGAYVFADETRLQQMLLNLCINAFHAMESSEQGVLRLTTQPDGPGHALITVQDTGCGISEEQLPRIFEPFYTTKEARQGTGLGLAIVAQVVSEVGGDIHVDSTVGEGTTIRIRLPLPGDAPQ